MNFTSSVPLRYLYHRGIDRDEFTNDFINLDIGRRMGYDDRERRQGELRTTGTTRRPPAGRSRG